MKKMFLLLSLMITCLMVIGQIDYEFKRNRAGETDRVVNLSGTPNFSNGLILGNLGSSYTGAIRLSGGYFQGYNGTAWDTLSVSVVLGSGWTKTGTNVALTNAADSVSIRGKLALDSTTSIGRWGYTGEHIVVPETSSNTNAGLGGYFMVGYSATAGKVFAGTYSRMLAMTTNQTNQSTMVGTESQFRLRDVDIADGVHAGIWAYAEQSGTSTLSGGGTFDAISATVESEAGFTVGATEQVTGITIDASINAGASINASANYSAVYIKSNGKDWFNGIKITGCDNDIRGQNGETFHNATNGYWATDGGLVSMSYNYAADTSSTDAYKVVIPDITAYAAGLQITFLATTANTGAATLTNCALAAIAIKKMHDQDLANGDIEANQIVTVVHDGSNFQMTSQLAQ